MGEMVGGIVIWNGLVDVCGVFFVLEIIRNTWHYSCSKILAKNSHHYTKVTLYNKVCCDVRKLFRVILVLEVSVPLDGPSFISVRSVTYPRVTALIKQTCNRSCWLIGNVLCYSLCVLIEYTDGILITIGQSIIM